MSNPIKKVNYELAQKALDELKQNPNNRGAYDLAESMAEKEAFNIKNWEIEVSKLNEKLAKMIENYNTLCSAVDRGSDKIVNSFGKLSSGEMEELEFQFNKVCQLRDSYLNFKYDIASKETIWSGKILEIAKFSRQPENLFDLKIEDFKLKSEALEYLELFTAYRAFSPPQKIVTEQKLMELITP